MPDYIRSQWIPADDIYACGVVAYRMLTGRLPSMSRLERIRVMASQVPEQVSAIVLEVLGRSGLDTYRQQIADLRRDCERALAATGSPQSWTSTVERASSSRRHGWLEPPAGLSPRLIIPINNADALAWSPDGRMLAVATSSTLQLIHLETGRTLAIQCRLISSMSWAIPSHEILAVCEQGVVAIDINRRVINRLTIANLPARYVTEIACSPDGLHVAIATSRADWTQTQLLILDRQTMSLPLEAQLFDERETSDPPWKPITDLAWSCDGLVAVGMYGARALIIDGHTGKIIQPLHIAPMSTSSFANESRSTARDPSFVRWAKDGSLLAVNYSDLVTAFWSVRNGTLLSKLDISCAQGASLAATGPLFAALADSQLSLWRYDQFDALATLFLSFERAVSSRVDIVSFHPERPILAAADQESIYLWDIDVDTLLGTTREVTVHYANAKVVIVGDSGVGKSALGLVLAGEAFRPTDSTHGRHIWTLESETLPLGDDAKLQREVLLWDLAGQPGYRVFHRQHLDEASVALVLYDAHSETDPFAGVSYWARALDDATRGFPITKFLVAARIDRGGTAVSATRVSEISKRYDFSRCIATSARRGDDVAKLAAAVRAAINWDRLPRVSALKLFYDTKSFVLAEKLGGRVIQRRGELRERFLALTNEEVSSGAFDVCVGQLEAAGLVKRLSFGDLVLLQPEMLDAYSAWMALAARQEPEGLGFLSERAARAGDFRMDDDRPLRGRGEEALLLTATVEDVVGRGIALRQPTERGEMLVFPSELCEDMPVDVPEHVRALIFYFDGPVKSVYATLAVVVTRAC